MTGFTRLIDIVRTIQVTIDRKNHYIIVEALNYENFLTLFIKLKSDTLAKYCRASAKENW